MGSLRDVAEDIEVENARLFGISLDSVADQKKFHAAESLNFPLLSDPDGSATRKLGALAKSGRWSNRMTFFVDPKGVLRAVDEQVDVTSHGQDVLIRLSMLQD